MNRNITALILIVLAIGIYFTVTKTMIAGIREVQAVNAEYTSAIKSAEKLIEVRDKVREAWNNVAPADRERLEKMLPSTVDNIRLIIDLNSIAPRHGFTLENIKAVADSEKDRPGIVLPASGASRNQNLIKNPTLDTVTVSFNVTAPYQQFIGFLQDLEANLRIMDITHLTLEAKDTGMYDFTVELKTYWMRQ